jgi:uncharacterized membrane protein
VIAQSRLGESAYSGALSIASLIGIFWLVAAYKHAPHVVSWGDPEWWKPIAIVLMLPSFRLAMIGLTTPNPTIIFGQEERVARPPQGIVRVTHYTFLTGVGLWGLVHLVANDDIASFVFFSALALTAVAGTMSIDSMRRRTLGSAWESFAAQTSIAPFAAIASGRTRFKPGEIGAWRWIAAVVAYALMLAPHAHVFGASLFPK